jgi:hypothetical protein
MYSQHKLDNVWKDHLSIFVYFYRLMYQYCNYVGFDSFKAPRLYIIVIMWYIIIILYNIIVIMFYIIVITCM